jgi:hypothetical protein
MKEIIFKGTQRSYHSACVDIFNESSIIHNNHFLSRKMAHTIASTYLRRLKEMM